MPETPLDSPRTWVELPDPEHDPATEPDGPAQVFRVDLTWLTSSWTCIYGRGCGGVSPDRPDAGCCALGAHFTDDDDEARIAAHVQQLTPATWQRHAAGADGSWVRTDDDGARTTLVVDGACVFHNDPGFSGGSGCALHHLAERHGLEVLRTKPDVCWQLPLRRTYRTVERPDGTSYLEVGIGEYDRRGWGPGGHDLHWYCTGNPDAHVGHEPVFRSLAAELVELIGAPAYERVAELCDAALAAMGPGRDGGTGGGNTRPASGSGRVDGTRAATRPGGRTVLPVLVHPATAARRGAAAG